jgi:Ca2+-binding RTX toxin-like protein
VSGTAADDTIRVNGSAGNVNVVGLPWKVGLTGVEPTDQLTVRGLLGNDTIRASALAAGTVALTLDGGDGDDTLVGSDNGDLLIGSRGNDTLFGGAGNDTFVWNPGDGNDIVEGQAGFDTLQFNGANIAEKMDLSANGTRLRFTRDVANIVMDVNGVEQVNVTERGGADTTTINDLTGTGVTNVSLDLAGTPGTGVGDGAVDTVIVQATNAADVVTISGGPGSVAVDGLATRVVLSGAEATDSLVVNGLDGDDVLNGSALAAGGVTLTLDGGNGDDVLVGSDGNDVLLGEAGDDVLLGGPGQDVLDGGTGNNILIQD